MRENVPTAYETSDKLPGGGGGRCSNRVLRGPRSPKSNRSSSISKLRLGGHKPFARRTEEGHWHRYRSPGTTQPRPPASWELRKECGSAPFLMTGSESPAEGHTLQERL